jgi:ACR3 family arsenite efflux pump ArsB
MKLLLILPLALAYLCHRAALKARGKGSWAADRVLDAVKWGLIGASVVILFL